MSAPITVSRDDVKRLSIYKQGLHERPATSTKDDLKRIIERIGLLQLDSISVIARSHYVVMHARAGLYDRAELDDLLTEGFLFEQWAHVACQIPMAHYPYFHPVLQRRKEADEVRWHEERIGEDADEVIERVIETIRENGPMTSKDFDNPRKTQGGWWNWKPAKLALEYLFRNGDLMITTRTNFHRHYDLAERVLDRHNITFDKTVEDYQEWTAIAGLRHVGIGTLQHISDYYREGNRQVLSVLQSKMEAGEVHPVEVEGWDKEAYIHNDDLPLLQEIQAGKHAPQLTAFLSPFDSLVWNRDRNEALWDFYYRIEVYTPKAKRVYGYYVLPILHKGELIGRIDPKVDRKAKKLLIHAIHFEDGITITDDITNGLITAFKDFMAFHHCKTIEIGKCEDKSLKKTLEKALK